MLKYAKNFTDIFLPISTNQIHNIATDRFPKQIHIVNYLNHLKTLRGSFESLLAENGGANDRLRKENHEVRSVRKYSKFLGCEPPCSPIGKQTEIDRKGSVKLD